MKNSNLVKIFMIMFLFTCSYAEVNRVAKLSDKTVKNNVVYLKGEKTPFSGKIQDGGIEQEYRNGIKNGIFKGKIQINGKDYLYEGKYVEGIKDGIWTLKYLNGKKRAVVEYSYDKPVNKWKYYYENGQLESEETFDKSGVLSGEVAVYDEEGNVLKKANYLNGFLQGEVVFYESKGVLDTVANFDKGKLNGKVEVFSINSLQLEGNYKDNKRVSVWKLYYTSGDLKVTVPYRNGLKSGKSIVYDRAGGIVQVNYYKDNNEVTADGKLIREAKPFKDGIVEKFKKFNANLNSLKVNKALSEV